MNNDFVPVYNPVSTYRIQFSEKFGFRDIEMILEYLHDLGVRTIYASPIFEAMPGSPHGYDVINSLKLNPAIGNNSDFVVLRNKSDRLSIGWIQDIVPNHMAYSPLNPWIADVLKNGRQSAFQSFFDIDWDHPDPRLNGKIMLPFFGKDQEQLVDDNELSVVLQEEEYFLKYFDTLYPLSQESNEFILYYASGNEPENKKSFLKAGIFSGRKSKEKPEMPNPDLEKLNANSDFITELLSIQHYRLYHWRETNRLINFRRFFTINDMIGLRMEDKKLFDEYHNYIAEMSGNGLIKGVRVDHIDGLLKPGQYLRRLRSLLGDESYIIVEKILEKDEEIPLNWPIQGSTGYEFATITNQLFTNYKNEDHFSRIYDKWDKKRPSYDELSYKMQSFIVYKRMGGDIYNLAWHFLTLFPDKKETLIFEKMKIAIAEFLIHCPIYKIYRENIVWYDENKKLLKKIFKDAVASKPDVSSELGFLKDIFLNERNEKYYEFFLRCMQYSGALMAKGLEDTVFYSYSRFVALNEVGDSPDFFGIDAKTFHNSMVNRREQIPYGLNASSTHDSKRGEDFRARLTVISDLPKLWEKYVFTWRQLNAKFKQADENIPSANDEYYIYQTLAGSFPFRNSEDENYTERLCEYIVKSVKEAKENTSWADPDEAYENGICDFIKNITNNKSFMDSFIEFRDIISDYGLINSLSQQLLKNTCPGIPDLYQGSESWNFSFTDPDNRKDVDFEKLKLQLKELQENENNTFSDLWEQRYDGKIKLWLTHICLYERIKSGDFFNKAEYIPLDVTGEMAKHVLAFLRRDPFRTYMVVIPMHLAAIGDDEKFSPDHFNWSKTYINLPPHSPAEWKDVLWGKEIKSDNRIKLSMLISNQAFAFLKGSKKAVERKAGILLHISSLPGTYGVGDMGTEAYTFVDFLFRTSQSYWQILPLSYTDPDSGYSPYSSLSAFAGNPLFISPELLVEDGYLKSEDIIYSGTMDYRMGCFEDAATFKNDILNIAWQKFLDDSDNEKNIEFRDYCERESYWLDDFALFIYFKGLFSFKKWSDWPDAVKNRDKQTIEKYKLDNSEEIDAHKFFQFLFMKQWELLKSYAADKRIKIFGDIPIYVSYDSVDVWSHPELFRLKSDKSMESVAGVPPDYFDDDGQFWNMPLYRWDVMKTTNYRWWIARLKKNLELYDLLRIDHFRAFSKFWEIPGTETTAVNGKWVEGPGENFFEVIRREFPHMPFVAEDLGEIDQAVYDLRDQFHLPGMHVVQFAFGNDMPQSVHIPHNHLTNNVVYSGTHDNNTLQGWLKHELDEKAVKRLENYTDKKIRSRESHFEIIRICYSSVSKIVIIPMQDWLGLDEKARMNKPSTKTGNWIWRMESLEIDQDTENLMREFSEIYGRN